MTLSTLILALQFVALPEMNGDVADVWNTYMAGDFRRVNQQVIALSNSSAIRDRDKAILWLTLGCSEAMLGNTEHSAEAFTRSLGYHSDFGITSSDLPPPVWAIYQQVKQDYQIEIDNSIAQSDAVDVDSETLTKIEGKLPIKSIHDVGKTIKHPYKSSAIKSVIFPGWGQLSDGRGSGKYIIATEIVLVTGFIVTAMQTSHAREDYLKERVPESIEDKYSKYNNLSRLSTALAFTSVGAYLLAQLDYFGKQNQSVISNGHQTQYLLSVSFTM